MTGEPFCLRPWEIAQLTDLQIDELFAKPQAELAKRMKGTEGPGEPPPEPTADELANVTEEQYVRGGLMLGGTREHWQAEYRRQWGKG